MWRNGKPHEPAAFMALLAVAILLRMPGMGESLWTDEAFYSLAHLGGSGWRQVAFRDVHPPLYPLLMRAWIALFGQSEFVLRLPSLLMGLGSLVLAWAWVRRIAGRWGGMVALTFLALSPVHIWYSTENKANMLLLFSVSLFLYAATRWWDVGDRLSFAGLWLGGPLALFGHGFALWPIAATLLWMLILCRRRPEKRGAVLALTAFLALTYGPFAIWKVVDLYPNFKAYLRTFDAAELYSLLTVYLPHGNTLRTVLPGRTPFPASAPAIWLDGLCVAVLASGLVLAARRASGVGNGALADDAARHRLLLLVFALPLAALLALSAAGVSIYIERSVIFSLVPYAALVGLALSIPRSALLRGALLLALVVFSSTAVYTLRAIKPDVWTVYKPKEDWRTAAAYLSEEIRASGGDHLIFVPQRKAALTYYGVRSQRRGSSRDRNQPQGRVLRVIQIRPSGRVFELASRRPNIPFWVVGSVYERGTLANIRDLTRRPELELVTTKHFDGIAISRYQWVPPAR